MNKKLNLSLFSAIAIFMALINGCNKSTVSEQQMIQPVNTNGIQNKFIFFGHQSVGANILDGVKDLDTSLTIFDEIPTNTKPGIYQKLIGENYKPELKIRDFVRTAESLPKENKSIAFMKICYVDINKDTDVQKLFDDYKSAMSSLHEKRPDIDLIHFTSPLIVRQTGPKAWVKKLLGKPIYGVDDNIKRFQYNQMIRKEYGKDVFDLAGFEADTLGGKHLEYDNNGLKYEMLNPEFRSNSGHLNTTGRDFIARKLLEYLENRIEEKGTKQE